MAGIYIHIPFCKKACTYCDFYFSISLTQKENYLEVLQKEIGERNTFFNAQEKINTIYFGGGTPSILDKNDIDTIIKSLSGNFKLVDVEEITLECNPDDLSSEYLKKLEDTKINRLSIGVQSFYDPYLKFMNRRHDSKKSMEVLDRIKHSRFSNYSIDIIFGVPGQTKDELLRDLEIATNHNIPHISIYQLTYEPGTPLYYMLKKGRIGVQPQNESEEQYELIIEFLQNHGYEHYEVSNFAKPGMYSKHNTLYWKGEKYLGLGPGAHSYDGFLQRRWNYPNLKKYINAENYFEVEHLNETKIYNEIILTRLRTMWGISKNEFTGRYLEYFLQKSQTLIKSNYMKFENEMYKLSKKGMLIADKIVEELFFEE